MTTCRTCTKCGETKPLDRFGRHAQGKFGRRSICKICVSDRNRAYHQTPRGREVIERSRARFVATERGKQWRRDKAQRHRRHNPKRAKARSAVSQAVRSGRLRPPDTCSQCGRAAKVEAHHFRGYAEEHWLDVLWLCKTCHSEADTCTRRGGDRDGNDASFCQGGQGWQGCHTQ